MKTRQHILVVEDEVHLAHGIQYNLTAEGYEVTVAGDGHAALQLLANQPRCDLMVLDLMLPGMSGYAVCEAVRAAGHDMPILILSARTLSEDRTRGFDVGADQYLMKPFDLDELLSRVKNLLARHDRLATRKTAAAPAHVARFGQAEVNFDTFQVVAAGHDVRLTPLEMKLLAYFIENEGRVIPRQELLENVWALPGHITTRAVDQFILRLRKVFEPNPAQPRHFLTLRDAGYRFVAEPEAENEVPPALNSPEGATDESLGHRPTTDSHGPQS